MEQTAENNPLMAGDDAIHQQDIKIANNLIIDISKGMPHTNVTRLNINVFKEEFLPYFDGSFEHTDVGVFRQRWIELAGLPTNEVILINKDDEEIDRVPPILKDYIENEVVSSMPISHIAREIETMHKFGSGIDASELTRNLLGALSDSLEPNDAIDDDWDKFLGRMSEDKPTSTANPSASLEDIDDFGY